MMDKGQTVIQQKPLSHMIADEIKKRIWTGRIQFGNRLLEPDLAADFGVSRSSLREALQLLEHEGLVVNLQRKGTFVSSFNEDELQEVYEARFVLEKYAFISAVQNMKEEHIKELEAKVRLMKEKIHDDNWNDILDLDLEFHSYIVGLCGNSFIIKFYNLIQVQIRTFLSRLSSHYYERETLYQEHYELLEALKTLDPHKVEEKISEHIEDAGKRLFVKKQL